MHSLYVFDFLRTVSLQLKANLEEIAESVLNEDTLRELKKFQLSHDAHQGVYVVHYKQIPVYVGKANNVSDRLSQHLTKLMGRQRIEPAHIGYKALLLDKSMSTAANEGILISMFEDENPEMWNGGGFGPKDPGQQRDTTKPGKFDQAYPIKDDLIVTLAKRSGDEIALGTLFKEMKKQLPYVFRYDVSSEDLRRTLFLPNTAFTARALLQAAVNALGPGWKGAIISYGMVLYKNNKNYLHGEEINPES